MEQFRSYLDYLDTLVKDALQSDGRSRLLAEIDDVLGDEPAHELRRLVSLKDLRATGAFFTGSELSRVALEPLVETLDDQSTILDPACGMGDLLIACATRLPTESTLIHTLQRWGSQLVGRELFPEFVHAAKARLILTALRMGAIGGSQPEELSQEMFPKIEEGSGLTDLGAIGSATHIVLNPPYTAVKAPDECRWAAGKVNSAALFLEACVVHAQPGTRIVAILPDVLRSGSRYRTWRKLIESQSRQQMIKLWGQFDPRTDIDVFILDLEVLHCPDASSLSRWASPAQPVGERVGDGFCVRVGPVVDYRDPHLGRWFPFVKSRDLPAWETVRSISRHRRFKGTVLSPPFVVVRRTSRPGDKHRAIGTIIDVGEPVAVENHLLVVLPKDGSLKSCEELLHKLNRPETTQWLDQRIRCRHLTVSSLEEIPWWGDGYE